MAYRLEFDAGTVGGFHRIGTAEFAKAITALANPADPSTAIFTARKSIKKIRSLAILAEPALGHKAWRRLDRRLRDIARALSGHRDRDALAARLDELMTGKADPIARTAAFRRLKEGLASMPETARNVTVDPSTDHNGGGSRHAAAITNAIDDARNALIAASAEFPVDDQVVLKRDDVIDIVVATHKAARQSLSAAAEIDDSELLHDWRKLAQRHARHLQLISKSKHDILAQRAIEIRRMARLVGEEHDFRLLSDRISADSHSAGEQASHRELKRRSEERRLAARAAALAAGKALFGERRRDFAARLVNVGMLQP